MLSAITFTVWEGMETSIRRAGMRVGVTDHVLIKTRYTDVYKGRFQQGATEMRDNRDEAHLCSPSSLSLI